MKECLVIMTVLSQLRKGFEDAGWLANFCTILLFAVFIVGKIWILWRNKSLYSDNIEYVSFTEREEEYNKQYILEEDGQDVIRISSPDGIYDLNIYTVRTRKSGKLRKGEKVDSSKEDNLHHPLKLNKNEPIYIRTDLPCGRAKYIIEIRKYDYTVLETVLATNGKVGGISLFNKKIKRNLRSWLYYLCQ